MITKPAIHVCEADVAEGLEEIARAELQSRLGARATVRRLPAGQETPGVIQFTYSGELRAVLSLKAVQAVYLMKRFNVPRPKALLGDEHFRALLSMIALARSTQPDAYRSLYLSAAGSDSSVMKRLKRELSQRIHLPLANEEGDLVIRLRPSPPPPAPQTGEGGWEVLVRLSPRPLATRAWRVCNFEGALNAAVAHAMALLTRPTRRDVFVNLACGSGTLLIERLAWGPARIAIGCDIDARALACARENVAASRHTAALWQCDARLLPLPDRSVDALCADLPFGHLVGSHEENVRLYPLILAEAARVAKPGARFVLITHEVRLMEALLDASVKGEAMPRPYDGAWSVEKVLRVELGGLYPRIFVLRRM